QDTGLDAFRDLAVNRGDIYIVYGGSLNVSGNFTNDLQGAVYMGNRSGGSNTFTVAGDFTNATADSGLYLDSPASATVNGNLTNYGYILIRERTGTGETASLTVGGSLTLKSTGFLTIEGNATLNGNGGMLVDRQSGLDMGGQPNVNTLYTTKLQIKNGIEFRGAFLTGTGTIFADLIFTQGGSVFSPGHSPGQMVVNGSLAFDTPTHFKIEIGGHTPGTEYDQVIQHSTGSGGVTLNGVLDLSIVNGFQSSIANSDSFSILTSDVPLSGAFTNVASGSRVNTVDGAGSFRVDYSGTSVVVSQFQGAPLPIITSIPFETVPNRYITVLGVGLLGVTGANVNGLSTFASSTSETEALVYVPSNATSGPVTIITNHGNATSSSSLTILADSDSDGMSDAFEQQYFGNATAGDPNADSDGDGMSNVAEFLAGTDPTSGASAFRVTQTRKQGNDVVISFPSVANKRYRVQASTNVADQFPTTIAILPALGSSGPREVTEVNGLSNGKRFYRIEILQ
ncbi:MAG: thrombospondin type 3 repeat-containing protein, partial [Verrucomicrobiota bacterium]|nr:thrombospondin type 3 repeat-containing protein [Verrucomicrobiota bacterium]